jgi:hypothetical protein
LIEKKHNIGQLYLDLKMKERKMPWENPNTIIKAVVVGHFRAVK